MVKPLKSLKSAGLHIKMDGIYSWLLILPGLTNKHLCFSSWFSNEAIIMGTSTTLWIWPHFHGTRTVPSSHPQSAPYLQLPFFVHHRWTTSESPDLTTQFSNVKGEHGYVRPKDMDFMWNNLYIIHVHVYMYIYIYIDIVYVLCFYIYPLVAPRGGPTPEIVDTSGCFPEGPDPPPYPFWAFLNG